MLRCYWLCRIWCRVGSRDCYRHHGLLPGIAGSEIEVADTGWGIAKSNLEHIFDRFYQGGKSGQAAAPASGLAITRWIAAEHGGRIEVTSELG